MYNIYICIYCIYIILYIWYIYIYHMYNIIYIQYIPCHIFSLPRNHRFETRCTSASQNWLHGPWILQAKANGLTMGSKGKHSVQGQLASNKRAKNWPRGGGFPVPTYYNTFLFCFPRNAMAHLMWESMVGLVKYLPWWFTSLQWGIVFTMIGSNISILWACGRSKGMLCIVQGRSESSPSDA